MDYLIEDLLPARQVHLFAGASGAGKTTFLLQYLRDWLDGKDFFGHRVRSVPLAYVGADRPENEYEEKFKLMDIKPFPMYSLVSNDGFNPRDLWQPIQRDKKLSKLLERLREDQPDLGVLVLDPLSTFLPAKLGDYHTVADALVSLTRWCQQEDITLLGTHHATKLKPDTTFIRPQDRILGSAALLGYSGTHMFLSAAEETKEGLAVFTCVPHNYPPETHYLTRAKNGRFQLVQDAEGVVQYYNILREIAYTPNETPWASLREKLVSNTLSESTLKRQLKALLTDGYIVQPHHGAYSRNHKS